MHSHRNAVIEAARQRGLEIQGVQSTINLHQIVETQWETVCKEQQQQQTNPLCSSLGEQSPLTHSDYIDVMLFLEQAVQEELQREVADLSFISKMIQRDLAHYEDVENFEEQYLKSYLDDIYDHS